VQTLDTNILKPKTGSNAIVDRKLKGKRKCVRVNGTVAADKKL
jgi:hypothetical protein